MPCYQSDTIEHNGKEYVVELWHDADMGPPWKEHDGHGPVSDWTSRAKAPGELVLVEDRGQRRYYDFAEAVKIAKRDGWDAPPYDKTESPGRKAAKAAQADYEYLRRWCNDDWHWCGVVVRPAGACACCGPKESVWGIESDCHDYLHEVAIELIEQLEQIDSPTPLAVYRINRDGIIAADNDTGRMVASHVLGGDRADADLAERRDDVRHSDLSPQQTRHLAKHGWAPENPAECDWV